MMPLVAGGNKSLYPIWIPICATVVQFALLIVLVLMYGKKE